MTTYVEPLIRRNIFASEEEAIVEGGSANG